MVKGIISFFSYRMENHQNHKAEPDAEQEESHHHNQVWGTWEELLLACAVNRHGFKDWDTVAMEVQSRTTRLLATARHCEQKFHDLNRRFADQCNDDVPPPCQNGAAAGDNSDHVPWLDELRKLRVAELRREVQRRDVSILSLQLEVKRLEEEKAKENDGKEDEKPDLAVSGDARPENDKTGGEVEEAGPANSEPEIRRLDESTTNTDKMLPTTGDESDRENQSVNESNSTGSRFEKTGEGDAKLGPGPVPVHSGPKEPDPVGRKGKPVGEESNNGSYDTLAKVPTCESVPPSEERKVEEDGSSELHDSVAHSGEGGTRESSEVQSSASLTRKRKTRRRKEVSGGDPQGGEVAPENDEVAMAKSEPLVGVLELIKGHEQSSLFERRLESQESDRYKDIVKQHVDLETIHLTLQKGLYSSCTSAFYRDLLLLFTNATVFFPHDSTESRAARQLHRLVTAEMKNHGQTQSDSIPRKNDSLPPNAPLAKPDSLLSKHKASAPILVCRKRSSISAKPSSATFGQKGDQPIFNDKKERTPSDAKPPLKPSSSDTDEEEVPKAKEKPVTGARSLRRSNKNLNNKKLPSNSTPKTGSSASKPPETPRPEKSKAEGGTDKKRNAAADFLKRIKRNTSVEASRGGGGGSGGGSSSGSRGGGGGVSAKEQKKVVNNGKGEKGKERASRYNSGGGSGDKRNNKNIENNSQSKRSVGRPPKKAAETNAGSAKRGRESSASASKDKRPKKRSKK
ncbi:bromodomain adjacent to zinc finger domain protein 1A isoform X2 [Abrus precatorius]|uniref:Bromodomain adjacent to zinc finger domain protein 1A isoform X2 n=1 Tax=Abrus precatorius TaxID=3816 RepID=A0A8B8KC65_ABRPR|nr:bromodomain adjacent to zinc finger domain protein 1A isoform X2 [Abrus precatorius]